jgi:hypothetical protein
MNEVAVYGEVSLGSYCSSCAYPCFTAAVADQVEDSIELSFQNSDPDLLYILVSSEPTAALLILCNANGSCFYLQ